ncbi:MAG: AraC family transcriptional regulator [Bacteroidales bacterium]|nr:AraC family transcriptional regulator [Bacteroidales bacterium]
MNELYNISLEQFRACFPDAECISMNDDFFIMDVKFKERNSPLMHPCRFDGFMMIYCLSGHVRMSINLNEFDFMEGSLFLNVPGNLVKVSEYIDSSKEDQRYIVVAMTREFVSGLRMDVNKVFNEGLAMLGNPSIMLTEQQRGLVSHYISLMCEIVRNVSINGREAINSVLLSLFYVVSGIGSERIREMGDEVRKSSSRSKVIFEQFIKLVSEYHMLYRNVGFYADKLCLTPKYLSKLIKTATGRSAPDWIDAYVVLEAKNLLKYSNIAIKEVVYRLNFPNQSVFYKFFKARTGMTPSEYRNS